MGGRDAGRGPRGPEGRQSDRIASPPERLPSLHGERRDEAEQLTSVSRCFLKHFKSSA